MPRTEPSSIPLLADAPPALPLLVDEKKSTTSTVIEILRMEGMDAIVSSMLDQKDYASLKTTSRNLAGTIRPIRYRQQWSANTYNTIAYCGMASKDEAPCVWQSPVKAGSFCTDSMRNCAACFCTSCACGAAGPDAPIPDSWRSEKDLNVKRFFLACAPCIIPPQILGFFAGYLGYACGSVREICPNNIRQINPNDELMKVTPEEARSTVAPRP